VDPISRRLFLTRTAIGAAAAGVAVVAPSQLAGAATMMKPTAPKVDAVPTTSYELTEPVVARVVDAKRGLISILVGEREIEYTNHGMAQQLLIAAQ
jgi:hypothetical protein